MPREIVSVHVGQCGSQIGVSFWDALLNEFNISPDGSIHDSEKGFDEVFFSASNEKQVLARSIFLDLEPRVLQSIQKGPFRQLFKSENYFTGDSGGGAGNVWANGFFSGQQSEEIILEMLQREVESADSMDGFFLSHSVAGGTGSGLGSKVLEVISSYFAKSAVLANSVFPNHENFSDVVVQPYNSVLTLRRLIEHTDAVCILDNQSLNKLALEKNGGHTPTFEDVNSIISSILASVSFQFSQNCFMNYDLKCFIASLVPVPSSHFLLPSISFVSRRQTSLTETIRRLVQPRNILSSFSTRSGVFVSFCAIVSGIINGMQLNQSLQNLKERKAIQSIPWGPLSIQLGCSPFRNNFSVLLANHTSTHLGFSNIIQQFDKLWSRGAFLEQYKQNSLFGEDLFDFEQSRDTVLGVLEEYKEQESPNFLNK